jgi:hypothetical protein
MKRTALILVVLFSTILFSLPKSSDDIKNAEGSELVEKLVSIIKPVLEGKDYSKFKNNIFTEAYVINNNTYESIFEILDNPSKKETFIEGEGITVEFVHLRLTDNQSEAYMVLETKSADNKNTSWHSILFRMNENQKWQILSWHKS